MIRFLRKHDIKWNIGMGLLVLLALFLLLGFIYHVKTLVRDG